jgi:hypothetical protein
MRLRTLLAIFVSGLTLLVGSSMLGSSLASPAQDDLAAQLPDGEGKGYVQTICTSCHGLGLIVYQRKTRQGWEASVWDMLGRISAGLDREAEIISKYLSESFPAETSAPPAADPTADVGTSESTTPRFQIFHQVVFKFKPEVSEAQKTALLESGKQMLESIPQVATVLVGKVAQEDSEFPYGLVTGFQSEEDLQAYRSHPDHRKWLEEDYRPLVEKSQVTDLVAME